MYASSTSPGFYWNKDPSHSIIYTHILRSQNRIAQKHLVVFKLTETGTFTRSTQLRLKICSQFNHFHTKLVPKAAKLPFSSSLNYYTKLKTVVPT